MPRLTLPSKTIKYRFARGNQGLQNNKVILIKKICRVSESNQGHRDFQSLALPTELTRHIF